MAANHLLILDKHADVYVNEITKQQLEELSITSVTSLDQVGNDLSEANILLGNPNYVSKVIDEAENVEWVQSTFAGVDVLCSDGLRKDYQLTGVKKIFGPLMSEFVMGHILAIERHLFKVKGNQSLKIWQEIPYRSLEGLTIGVAGLGSIGRHVAKTANRFGMSVLGLKRTPGMIESIEEVFAAEAIDTFLPRLDYLVVVLPSTTESRHIMQKQHFRRMKNSAVLINVGRGSTINQDDLIWALQQGQIGGAVLDVFETEPLPESSPLWEMPNVFISPHVAATSFPHQIAEIFCDNYRLFFKNHPLDFLIDFTLGY